MRKVSRTRWITYDDDDDDASYDEWKTKKCKVGNENEKKIEKNRMDDSPENTVIPFLQDEKYIKIFPNRSWCVETFDGHK